MCYKLIYPKTKMIKFNTELSFERELPEKDNANSKRPQTLTIGHRAKQEDPLLPDGPTGHLSKLMASVVPPRTVCLRSCSRRR